LFLDIGKLRPRLFLKVSGLRLAVRLPYVIINPSTKGCCIALLSRSSILKVNKMCKMISPRVTFERIVTQPSIHYLLYSVCIFLPGILVQTVCPAPLFVRMSEMYLACWIMLRYHLWNMIGCVRYRILCLTAQLVLA